MNREHLQQVWRDSQGLPVNIQPVTDADLAALGYVKVGTVEETWTITDEVDEDDLLAQGYVKRPACTAEGCENGKRRSWSVSEHTEVYLPCPSCGGSGFGRLVALDGIPDVATLSKWMDPLDGVKRVDMTLSEERLCDVVRPLLAALEGENTP